MLRCMGSIRQMLRRIHSSSVFRFILVGGSTTLCDFVLYSFLLSYLSVTIAKTTSMLLASAFSYIVNKKFTFQDKSKTDLAYLIRFYIVFVANFVTNVYVNTVLFNLTGRKFFAYVIATLTGMTVNYLGQRYFVFTYTVSTVLEQHKYKQRSALELDNNIEIISKAYKLLTVEHFLIKYNATFTYSTFSGITEDQHKIVTDNLKFVRQDFTKIMVTMNSIDRAFKWYKTGEYPNTYYSILGEQAREDLGCLIEFLFAKYRVILEYIQKILEILIPPLMTQSDEASYNSCHRSHEKFKWLVKYIADHYGDNNNLMNTDWFQDLRETRNALIHRGASCLVFGDKNCFKFNIYTPKSLEDDEEIIEWDDFYIVGNNNIVSYERYWGLYFSKLIVFTNAIFEFMKSIGNLSEETNEIIKYSNLDKPNGLVDDAGNEIPDVTAIPGKLLENLCR